MSGNTQSATAMDGSTVTFNIADPNGNVIPFIRVSVEYSSAVSEDVMESLERWLMEISDTISAKIRG